MLDGACPGDPELRGEIESLLRSEDDAGDFSRPKNCGDTLPVLAMGAKLR